MAVDHRGLNAFLNVARLGSVGAAATALSLTQPAVSRTLRKLEKQLGVQLFVRHSTGMELTAFGRSLLPHATLLESGLHRALEEIDLMRGASKGIAGVGIVPSLVPEILPTVVRKISREYQRALRNNRNCDKGLPTIASAPLGRNDDRARGWLYAIDQVETCLKITI